ncbi:MAG TPA: hypothetical protein VKS25_02960 [Solirubrobacteraceae bacterium]|nr:hypothetical protein [Solirubrobacteraceae bacterium]
MSLTIARRMVGAEFLKLRKSRSTVIWSLLLAVGSVVIFFVWRQLSRHGGQPTGGTDGFWHGLELIGIFIAPLAAVLIGAEAGAGDTGSGVFRDLVVTGRSRVALFAARIPGALMLVCIVVSLSYGAMLAATFAFAGSLPNPSASDVLAGWGWALLVDGAVCVVAVGLASLTQSRPATITVLVGFELVASPLLLQTSSLGHARDALLDASVLRLSPVDLHGAPVVGETAVLAVIVMLAWMVVAAAAGAWRTHRADA